MGLLGVRQLGYISDPGKQRQLLRKLLVMIQSVTGKRNVVFGHWEALKIYETSHFIAC